MRRERSDAILTEVSRLIVEQGCAHVRVEDVAERVGIAKGTVYLDFSGKEQLIAAALQRCGEQFLEGLDRHLEGVEEAGDRLVEAVRYLARVASDALELTALLHRPAHRVNAQPYLMVEERYMALVQAAVHAGSMAADADAELLAQMLLALATVPSWRRIAQTKGPEHAVRGLVTAVSGFRLA